MKFKDLISGKEDIKNDGSVTFYNKDGEILKEISVEIAETPSKISQGLRKHISPSNDSGMLFIFEKEKDVSMWMKDTPLALDIIFIDSSLDVVDIKDGMPYSEKSITAKTPAKFVIETRLGFSNKFDVDTDCYIEWKRY